MIILKSDSEISRMHEAGKIVAGIIDKVKRLAEAGVATMELDKAASTLLDESDSKSAFLGYRDYPAAICTSINEEVVHGIPSLRRLKEGDLLSIDVGVLFKGYFADASVTIPVGAISENKMRLLEIARKALYKGIEQCLDGNRLFDISAAIQKTAESAGFSVVRDFVGHGIGQQMHEEPQIPNFAQAGKGPLLKAGMVLALEPMVNEGTFEVKVLDDGWTVVTADGKPSCHFEHTVAITKEGPKILTST